MKFVALALLAVISLTFPGDSDRFVRDSESFLQTRILPGVVEGYVALGEAEMLIRLPR